MNKQYIAILFLIGLSCADKKDESPNPPGYDLTKPEKFNMPDGLHEISGISFYKGNSDTLYAEQDEEGKLFYLHLGDEKAAHAKFGKKGDYEDMAIINDHVVMLRSDGVLFSFPFNEIRQKEIPDVKEWDGLLPEGEFEGLFAGSNNKLYVLCKHCGDDETTKAVNAYILEWHSNDSIAKSGNAVINVQTIEMMAGEKKFKFHPSALAQNPKTNQWYIVSAVNKLLVIADNNWDVTEVYHLNPAIFRQPEGIAFDKDNNLYISNEGDDVSPGNVLKFVFKESH